MNTTSGTSLRRYQYDKMERAMFDYIEIISDEFFVSVPKKDMDAAVNYFIDAAHEKMHAALASVISRACRGMERDH